MTSNMMMQRCNAWTRSNRRCKHKAYTHIGTYFCHIHVERQNVICNICLEVVCNKTNEHITSCNHIFHKGCFIKWMQIKNTCPSCRTPIKRYVYMTIHIFRKSMRKYHKGVSTSFWINTLNFNTSRECVDIISKGHPYDNDNKKKLSRMCINMVINGQECFHISFTYLPNHVLEEMFETSIHTKLCILTNLVNKM